MTAGIWILLGLQQGWQDLLIYMHRYGIPQIAVFTDRSCSIRARNATFSTTRLLIGAKGRPRCS